MSQKYLHESLTSSGQLMPGIDRISAYMKLLRNALSLSLVALLAAAVWWFVENLELTEELYLTGPLLVGLCFSLFAIIGVHTQTYFDMQESETRLDLFKAFFRITFQLFIFLVLFTSGIWGLVAFFSVGLPAILGERGLRLGILYYPAFLFFIFLVISILTFLADKGHIGPRNK